MSGPGLSRNGRAALAYISQGWRVLPITPGSKVPLGRLAHHGSRSATTNPGEATGWWLLAPDAGVGIATGPESGFWVLDVDPRHGGDQSLDDLVAEHGPMPDTLVQETGNCGLHYLFTWPTDGRVPRHSPGPGLDVKGDGGYIVTAPSLHPDTGREYCWQEPAGTLCPAPEWLLDLVATPRVGDGAPVVTSPDEWLRLVTGPVPEGERNAALARVAGLLFRRLPPTIAADLAEVWAASRLRPPLDPVEVRRTLASIAGRELARRGGGQ